MTAISLLELFTVKTPTTASAAYRLSIVPAWRAGPECLLSSNQSEPTEFRFGSTAGVEPSQVFNGGQIGELRPRTNERS
jgi:hypothetical protein